MIQRLAELAQVGRTARIGYQKAAEPPKLRLVEPYSLQQGNLEILIRCYQLDPEEGWRSFKHSKIRSVEDGGSTFHPRRRIAFSCEIKTTSGGRPGYADEYSDFLCGCLADLCISPEELAELRRLQQEFGLTSLHIRKIHLDIFMCALKHVDDDATVDDAEEEYLRRMRECLTLAGYCP